MCGACGGVNFPDTLAGRCRLWSWPTTHLADYGDELDAALREQSERREGVDRGRNPTFER